MPRRGDASPHLLRPPSARDGKVAELREQLLVQIRDAVGERARPRGIPIEIADRRGALDHRAYLTAASTNDSYARNRRNPSSPNTDSSPSI